MKNTLELKKIVSMLSKFLITKEVSATLSLMINFVMSDLIAIKNSILLFKHIIRTISDLSFG